MLNLKLQLDWYKYCQNLSLNNWISTILSKFINLKTIITKRQMETLQVGVVRKIFQVDITDSLYFLASSYFCADDYISMKNNTKIL